MGLLIHIEDEPLKARALGRLLGRLRPDLTVEHYEAANVGRRRLRDAEGIVAVVTDWNMPLLDDGGMRRGAGELVVHDCERFGLPVVVVSGDEKPWAHRELQVPWVVFRPGLSVETELRSFLDAI